MLCKISVHLFSRDAKILQRRLLNYSSLLMVLAYTWSDSPVNLWKLCLQNLGQIIIYRVIHDQVILLRLFMSFSRVLCITLLNHAAISWLPVKILATQKYRDRSHARCQTKWKTRLVRRTRCRGTIYISLQYPWARIARARLFVAVDFWAEIYQ